MRCRCLVAMIGVVVVMVSAACTRPSTSESEDVGIGRSAAERVDDVLAGAVRRQEVLGVVAMAVDRDGVFYRGARGTADDILDMPMRTDAIFRIASMTKPVTSVAAMQLVERGLIDLDVAAADYLPELDQALVVDEFDTENGAYTLRPPQTPITLRHLLTHTAGFGYWFTSATARDFEPSTEDQGVIGPLLFEPGTGWLYGTSTDWVGRVVEEVSGQSLEDYFCEHIFDRLQMVDTSFNVQDGSWLRTVTVSRRQSSGALVQQVRDDPVSRTEFSGGGGLWSTASDYSRFMRMWLNDGELDGVRILLPETVAMMGENQIGSLNAGEWISTAPESSNDFHPLSLGQGRWGLGFLLNRDDQPGRRASGSLAWAGLYNTYFWIDPTHDVAGCALDANITVCGSAGTSRICRVRTSSLRAGG
ncbi:MAG: serine hydrolase domain-containing protein [Vicinamibacterales bacterium]